MLGWRPADLYSATAFEFWCVWDGFIEFHRGGQSVEPLSRGELDELLREHG